MFIFFALWFAFKIAPQEESFSIPSLIIYLIVFISILKLPVAFYMQGFESDVGLFVAWGDLCNNVGFNNVYFQDEIYLDYPPLYLYVLAFLDRIRDFLAVPFADISFYTMLIKVPAIIADAVIAYLLYKTAKKKFSNSHSIYLSLLYLLNPLSLVNSAVWGQIDSIMLLILLYSLIKLNQDKFVFSGIFLGLGILLKPQMLIFVPVFLFYTIFKKNFWGLLNGITATVATILILALPFTQSFDFSWLIEQYASTIDYYNYYSVNAYNFLSLIGLNWVALPEGDFFSAVLSVAAPTIATILCGVYMYFNKEKYSVFTAAALIMATTFMFATKMHERYLFPTVFLVLFAFLMNKDKKFLYTFIAFSVANYLNVAIILYMWLDFTVQTNAYVVIVSAINFGVYIYFMYLIFIGYKLAPLKIETSFLQKFIPPKMSIKIENVDRKLHKRDFIVIVLITGFYAVFAFWELGSNTMVSSSWTPATGESTVVEILGESDTFLYLSGMEKADDGETVIGSDFTVEFSADGVYYENAQNLSETQAVYTWKELSISTSYRYIKITANSDNSLLTEIAFRSTDGQSLVSLSDTEVASYALIDEQELVPLYPGYYDSMYFDEIYHARTAYEHLLGLDPYETTHPPLGKMIISFFITIFGMTPFGWRFAGALFGVLMLPVFYHILKRLFGSSFFASCGTMLFAFDFMHFTQTRIATIDTYAVFFILLMYDAMLIFLQKDITENKLKNLVIPLALSGLFMGLGIASKWTCAYGAVGLAVLFFTKLFISYRRSFVKKATLTRILHLCLVCLAFFVAVPFAIYFASYLPIILLNENCTNIMTEFVNWQVFMFEYHSGLVAEHYFASPWYEWPLVIQNIWYFISNNYQGTGKVSTISCFGNPVIWWTALVGFIYTCVHAFKKRTHETVFVLVGFMSVYLPWVLVPRLTFIYHYFTAVPFIIFGLIYLFTRLNQSPSLSRNVIEIANVKISVLKMIVLAFVIINFLLFVLFYPAISGSPTTREYLSFLKWLPDWVLA